MDICIDTLKNAHVTGIYDGVVPDMDPGPGTYTLNFISTHEIFVMKLGCAPAGPSTINGSLYVCPGTTKIYSVSPVYGATSYSWSLPSGWTGSSSTNSISVTIGLNSGTISATTSNTCGTSLPTTLFVTTPPMINASSSNTTCIGQTATLTATGASNYTWTPGNILSPTIAVTPSATTQYTVKGSVPSFGCTYQLTVTQVVNTCTSINELEIGKIMIYPNPVLNKLNIDFQANSEYIEKTLEVYNVLGELMFSELVKTEKIEIDFSNKPLGIYFVRVGKLSIKVIKS